MMILKMQTFEGEVSQVAAKFNAWSDESKYINSTSFNLKGKERTQALLVVIYGEQGVPAKKEVPRGGYIRRH